MQRESKIQMINLCIAVHLLYEKLKIKITITVKLFDTHYYLLFCIICLVGNNSYLSLGERGVDSFH